MEIEPGKWKLFLMNKRNWTAVCAISLPREITTTSSLQRYLVAQGWHCLAVNEYEKRNYKLVLIRR